jgi:hypothetical protein
MYAPPRNNNNQFNAGLNFGFGNNQQGGNPLNSYVSTAITTQALAPVLGTEVTGTLNALNTANLVTGALGGGFGGGVGGDLLGAAVLSGALNGNLGLSG